MVKKYPITQAEQVHLCCDKCEEFMVKDSNSFSKENEVWAFNYVCPKCGHKHRTETQYPYQILTYNLAAGSIIQEIGG